MSSQVALAEFCRKVSSIIIQQNFPPYIFVNNGPLEKKIKWVNSARRGASEKTLRTARGSTNKKLTFLLCRFLMFLVRVLLLWDCLLWPVLPYITRFWPHIYDILTEVFRKNTSVWYSTSSSPGDLPNERKISDLFICDQFSYQNPFIQLKNPPYKLARKQLKVSIDHFHRFFFFFWKLSACR